MPGNVLEARVKPLLERLIADGKISGRKVNRWTVNLLVASISAAVAVAVWRWAFGHPFPPIPGEGLIIAALPYLQSMFDNFVRTMQRQTELATNMPQINPHGGPAAP